VATDAVRHGSWLQNVRATLARTGPFLREVQIEATRTIIIVVLVIAGLIALMDLFFQAVFVSFIPSLFK